MSLFKKFPQKVVDAQAMAPIIDPVLNYHLCQALEYKFHSTEFFFIRYLLTSSRYLNFNSQTIEAATCFRNILLNNISMINEIFKIKLTKSELNDPTIVDFYKYVYDKIDFKYKSTKRENGFYKRFTGYKGMKMDFFQPILFKGCNRSWFFGNSPIAILCIHINEYTYDSSKEAKCAIQLMLFEINILLASGFTLVLCIELAMNCKHSLLFLKHIVFSCPFSEIHINISDRCKKLKSVTKFYPFAFFNEILNNYSQIYGYLYINLQTISKKYQKVLDIIEKIKQFPRNKFTFFSTNLSKAIKPMIVEKIKPFIYCENAFKTDLISVSLFNVPLYMNEDEDEDNFPSEASGLSIGYISKNDFMNWKPTRVKIIFHDETNNNFNIQRFIDFDDVHLIKSDMIVDNTIYLTYTKAKTLQAVLELSSEISKKVDETKEIKKENVFSFQKDKLMLKMIAYVSSIYAKCASETIQNFKIHNNQILTVYEACRTCLFNQDNKNKGIIYQVETGEGKSCIILIIAASLALMKKRIHIASSNINLANRDYYDSYDFFKKLGLTSAVLLHYNELPYININHDTVNNSSSYDLKYYPNEYFSKDLFENSLNMNFSVCGLKNENETSQNKADIVFSTFVNFECLYLKMIEICPGFISKYYQKCSLLIDEVDSILIDEIANGTILSQEVKSNGNEILQYVYQSRLQGISSENVLKYINKKWPKCSDITLDDIDEMFREIDIVNQDEFVNGKKYSIETLEIKENMNILDLIEKAYNFYENAKIKVKNGLENIFTKRKYLDSANLNEKNEDKIYKKIIPFDYDHKGVLEPNKEFGGFIQQFIAIKEILNNKENSNIIIKNLSMNYLFISHPIFVNLYSNVCGLTGTIGSNNDKSIFSNQYKLITKKIPREKPNYRIDLNLVLCEDINERNQKIVSNVTNINKKGNPVLVIFQDLNELYNVLNMLISNGIKSINVYDGKDKKNKPDFTAGMKGSVSLGTNFCGRGTDIQVASIPLHVIITYYSSNKRVMQQAFGRTARQGHEGTVQIICLEKDFYSPIEKFNDDEINHFLDDIQFKNLMQMKFIEKFRKNREWIFNCEIEPQKLNDEVIQKIRSTLININRIKVCNYEFPICMSIKTFLSIQAQKIFSLYNCPNCKYTWMLFQKYIREMIFESWSLLVEKSEKKYKKKKRKILYTQYLELKVNKLIKLLEEYLPESQDPLNYQIVPTFMNIYDKIIQTYENDIMKVIPKELTKIFKQTNKKKYCSFFFGFKPFSLIDKSGARINTLDGTNQNQNYIIDPELKFMKKQPTGHPLLLSITEKIDGIFNWICNKINEIIGGYIGLRFFLRRTLGGCEFGLCFDFNLINQVSNNLDNFNCLIDQNPLLMFTITVKSLVPVLAGILIIGLVYVASISESIIEWISAFPAKITEKVIKKTVVEISKHLLQSEIIKICDAICSFLLKILQKQISSMEKFEKKMANIFKVLMKIAIPKDFSKAGDIINELFKGNTHIKFNSNLENSFFGDNLPIGNFLKIGFILMLCFSSFLMNFHFHRKSLKYSISKTASKYDKSQNPELSLQQNKKIVKNNELEKLKKIDFNS